MKETQRLTVEKRDVLVVGVIGLMVVASAYRGTDENKKKFAQLKKE